MDIAFILSRKYPTAQWRMNGDEYANLEWASDEPQPTEAELQTLWPIVQQEIAHEAQAANDARAAAIAHAKSLGFTDEMIAVMYPNLAN